MMVGPLNMLQQNRGGETDHNKFVFIILVQFFYKRKQKGEIKNINTFSQSLCPTTIANLFTYPRLISSNPILIKEVDDLVSMRPAYFLRGSYFRDTSYFLHENY